MAAARSLAYSLQPFKWAAVFLLAVYVVFKVRGLRCTLLCLVVLCWLYYMPLLYHGATLKNNQKWLNLLFFGATVLFFSLFLRFSYFLQFVVPWYNKDTNNKRKEAAGVAIDKQIRIAVRLEPDLKEQFYKACEKQAVNPSALVRLLIKEWMDKQNIKE